MKLLVTFSRKGGRQPVIAQTVQETGVLINVERAHIDAMAGEVLIDVPDEDVDRVIERLKRGAVDIKVLENAVIRNEDECIDCGACVSVCPQDVFSFDTEWCLRMEPERCVLCGRCVQTCPHNALSIYQ